MAGKRARGDHGAADHRAQILRQASPSQSGCTTTAVPAIVPATEKPHYDQYCMLMLLYLFNPIVTSAARLAASQRTG